MIKRIFVIIFLAVNLFCSSQNVDSLLNVFNLAKHDTVKFNAAIGIFDIYLKKNPYESEKYVNAAIQLALKCKLKPMLAKAYMKKGVFFKKIDVHDTSIIFFNKARDLFLELKNYKSATDMSFNIATSKGNSGQVDEALKELDSLSGFYKKEKFMEQEAMCYSNMADLHDTKGEFEVATKLLFKAIDLFEKCKKPERKARALNEVANVMRQKGDYKKALDYAFDALALRQQIGDNLAIGSSYTTLGNIYGQMNDLKNAKVYMLKCYKLYSDIGMESGLAVTCNNLGLVYEDTKPDSAIYYYKKSIELKKKYTDTDGLDAAYLNLAGVHYNIGKLQEALVYLKEAVAISKEGSDKVTLLNGYSLYGDIYLALKDYKNAATYQKLYISLNDSIYDQEAAKSISEVEAKYQNEKKQLEIDNLNKQKEIDDKELSRQQTMKMFYGVGLLLVLVVLGIAYRGYRVKKRDNEIISAQKSVVEAQKHIVEEKNKEILDSINYAKKLQEAILPPLAQINEQFKENFVYYQPKDIVAGDFYWLSTLENQTLIAAADCTGHGVPGAMVSVVCSNALNRSVVEFGKRIPGEILDESRKLVLETFSKSSAEVKDGMDISLLSVVKKNGNTVKVEWAGANNPLWYIVDNNLHDITANKQPIGMVDNPKPFTTHSIELNKGTMMYLITDGYADQFGGVNGKKYKYKQLKELLMSVHQLPAANQMDVLNKSFNEWKGSLEQVDDVCIIGIRL
jgi:serine phosphatase RsbU (regulator of sigma subunit)